MRVKILSIHSMDGNHYNEELIGKEGEFTETPVGIWTRDYPTGYRAGYFQEDRRWWGWLPVAIHFFAVKVEFL